RPAASLVPARIRSRKWPSIHSRVKSFGTVSTSASAETSAGSTWLNQVWKVVSFNASRKRADTSFQRLFAVSSLEFSTPSQGSWSKGREAADNSSVLRASQRCISGGFERSQRRDLQGLYLPPHVSPQVWKAVFRTVISVALSTTFLLPTACG